jgi:hypothetical protein
MGASPQQKAMEAAKESVEASFIGRQEMLLRKLLNATLKEPLRGTVIRLRVS